MDDFPSIPIHPILCQEFQEKCRQLKIKNPTYLVATLIRNFIIDCDMTNNNPEILIDSTLVEKNTSNRGKLDEISFR